MTEHPSTGQTGPRTCCPTHRAADKDDYTPKFRIGDLVRLTTGPNAGLTTYRVAGRKVTRNRRTTDTYYDLGAHPSTGYPVGAWEWNVEAASQRVGPLVAAERAVRLFATSDRVRPSVVTVTVTDRTVVADVVIDALDAVTTLTADVGADGLVELVGPWRWFVARHAGGVEHHGEADSVGSAMVESYNATHRLGDYAS